MMFTKKHVYTCKTVCLTSKSLKVSAMEYILSYLDGNFFDREQSGDKLIKR